MTLAERSGEDKEEIIHEKEVHCPEPDNDEEENLELGRHE